MLMGRKPANMTKRKEKALNTSLSPLMMAGNCEGGIGAFPMPSQMRIGSPIDMSNGTTTSE